jgi:hypothetical protein
LLAEELLRSAETVFLWPEDRHYSYGFSEIYSVAGWLFLSAEVSAVNTGIESNVFVAYPKD